MEARLDPGDVERARSFWAEEDVDQVFRGVLAYLDHLRGALKGGTATDQESVQALKLLEVLDRPPPPSRDQDRDSSVVQVVIGSGELLPAERSDRVTSDPWSGRDGDDGVTPPPRGEELLAPLEPMELQYRTHHCCRSCLPSLPKMHQALTPFWGHNPLQVPLLCGFRRLSGSSQRGGACVGGAEEEDQWDVVYKAPCGLSLRNHDDVMRYLLRTESYDVLQVDFFTFSPAVELDPPPERPHPPEQDLSRGAEPVPVELCVGRGGARPPDFRYRKDRWPAGCFLGGGPSLFRACCDCTDGCADANRCACAAMTVGGRGYRHQRLSQAVPSGLYECGPWCGCDRARCLNRLVQRGVRVRLQVFQTPDRGWGVRCRDDLDRGTFVCIYAGVVLQRIQSPAELPPPKLSRSDLPSDDEVEVVTEWLAPPVLEGRGDLLEPPLDTPTCSPLHVPVIQKPSDSVTAPLDEVQTVPVRAAESAEPLETVAMATSVNGPDADGGRGLKRSAKMEDVCFVDASRDGNVGRFLNHSCQPNLFVQNVFTDSHDPAFPVAAFFTSGVVKAGGELTWNYAANGPAPSEDKQEVPCLCCSDGCRGWLHIQEPSG